MSSIDSVKNFPFLTFKFILKKKMKEEDISYDLSYLASILRNDLNLTKKYIRYIIKNRHTFTSEKYMFNKDNITDILMSLQEEAVPNLQPSLLDPRYDSTLPITVSRYVGSKKKRRTKKKKSKKKKSKKRKL